MVLHASQNSLVAVKPMQSSAGKASDNRLSTGMIIALTIAIVIPPTLLLGAILGYLAAQ